MRIYIKGLGAISHNFISLEARCFTIQTHWFTRIRCVSYSGKFSCLEINQRRRRWMSYPRLRAQANTKVNVSYNNILRIDYRNVQVTTFLLKWRTADCLLAICFLSNKVSTPEMSKPSNLMMKEITTIGTFAKHVELSLFWKLTFPTCSFHFAYKGKGSTALSFGCRQEAHWTTGITHSFPSIFNCSLSSGMWASLVSIPVIMKWRWGSRLG